MVGGNGLTYEKLTLSAGDAQMIEQLKWSSESIWQRVRRAFV